MKTRRKQREKRAHAGIWTVLVVLVGFGLAIFGGYQGAMALVHSWCEDLPSVEDTNAFTVSEQSTIYASDYNPETGEGTVLAELYLEKRDPLTSLDQVSPYVVNGTIATEDERYYQHHGVDLQGIIRAVFVNLSGGQEGASTITQQLVRNTLLSDEATEISYKRKVREIELATEMEKIYTKEEILLMYLNTINYGDGCYGIQAAAENYYGVNASDLTIAQAATLIGIPNSPTMYDPYLNPEACKERRDVVLARMLSNGVITQEEYDAAKAEELNVRVKDEGEDTNNGIYRYEYFTTYVRDLLLKSKEEGGWGLSTSELFEGGLKVITTIDPTMQQYAQDAVDNQYANGGVGANQEFALTLIDPNTGFIKAMIGGRNFYEDQLNIATSDEGRPIGSTAKAFTLTDAIEKGISPSTRMNCNGPVNVPDGGTTHQIQNYGNTNYGTLTIADMTAVSSNTGYVRLSYTDSAQTGVSPSSIVAMQERLGLAQRTLSTGREKLPAVVTTTLGVGNANTTEMAAAYGTFATGGTYREPTPIIKILDRSGNIVGTDNSAGVQGEQVLSSEVSYAVTQVLEGVIYKSMGTATAAALPSGQIAAGKTGTTDNWADLWFVGYTPQLSCAVWTGDRLNQDTYYTDSWCQDIWRDLISNCLAGQPLEDFKSAPSPQYNSSYKGTVADDDDEDEEKDKEEETTDEEKDDQSDTSDEGNGSGTNVDNPGGETGGEGGNEGGEGGGTTPPVDPGGEGGEGGGTTPPVDPVDPGGEGGEGGDPSVNPAHRSHIRSFAAFSLLSQNAALADSPQTYGLINLFARPLF